MDDLVRQNPPSAKALLIARFLLRDRPLDCPTQDILLLVARPGRRREAEDRRSLLCRGEPHQLYRSK